jgi:hypothetical protein
MIPVRFTEFVEHHHGERNHQALENELIAGAPTPPRLGRIRRRERLGGLLKQWDNTSSVRA